jgi:hypothetical protein
MTSPESPAKPVSSADKGWTSKVDAGIEDIVRSAWLLLTFPVAAPLRFLQWRRSATAALADARGAGRLLPPLLALGLALTLVPHLVTSIGLAATSDWHARSVLEHELDTRLNGLLTELLTRTAPQLILAWLGAQVFARLMTRVTGHAVDHAFNASLYVMAVTAYVVPLIGLIIISQIETPGHPPRFYSSAPGLLFTGLAALAALAAIGGTLHALVDGWRHGDAVRPWRRALQALAAAGLTISIALLLPLFGQAVSSAPALTGPGFIAQWLFPPDRTYGDDDGLMDIATSHCQQDGKGSGASLRCSLLVTAKKPGEVFLTELKDTRLEVVEAMPSKVDERGVVPIDHVERVPVAAFTRPSLMSGDWLSIKSGTTTSLTVRVSLDSACEAKAFIEEYYPPAADAASAPPSQRPRQYWRLAGQVETYAAGVGQGRKEQRLVLLRDLRSALMHANIQCPKAPPTGG